MNCGGYWKKIHAHLTYSELFLQTLDVTVNDEDGEKKEVKVLDIDTIGQVKSKVLDAIHRNRPYSNTSRLKPWQVDLGEFNYLSFHLQIKLKISKVLKFRQYIQGILFSKSPQQ